MARAQVTCQDCGDIVKIATSKNRRDADRYAEYLESNGFLCDECRAKAHAAENQKAAELNSAVGLPALTGSDKQIAWAETIRASLIDGVTAKLNHLVERDNGVDQEKKRLLADQVLSRISSQTSSSWWIDHRHSDAMGLIAPIAKQVEDEFKKGEFSQEADDAKAEATVRPVNEITPTCAEITAEGATIYIDLPEKIERFRVLMHELGYRWVDNCWTRKIGVIAGSVTDRMSEAVNKILAIGVPVRVFDEVIRNRGVAGEFEPEYKRWLSKITGGEHAGKIAISWPREEDWYSQAKSLPGAKYSKPNIVVPATRYEALLDFAAAYGFRRSPGAQEALDAARAEHDAAMIAAPAKAPKAESIAAGAMPAPTGEIDDDLRDN